MDFETERILHKQLLASSLLTFSEKMFAYIYEKPFIIGKHHVLISEALRDVVDGKTRNLIINIAPRYGKTIMVSQMFIAWGLALNPNSKFLHISYSGSLVLDNSEAIKKILRSEYFKVLFNARIVSSNEKKDRWSTIQGGGVYAVSTLGQITGFGAGQFELPRGEDNMDDFTLKFNPAGFSGAIVIDDPLKQDDALSDSIRETVNRRFETTIRNRANSKKTPIIIIMQRLHEHDLCGYLQEVEPQEWRVLSIPAIQTNNGKEEALWPEKHTLDDLYRLKRASEYVFETQYMQNPTPREGLMYREFKKYIMLPLAGKAKKYNYTDSADTGSDFLCSICYDAYPEGYYVTDVLYTDKMMQETEQALALMLKKNETELCFMESNNGGRIYARNVERITRYLGNRKTRFSCFAQTKNKQIRIFTNSNEVNNMIIFPTNWESRWPEFAQALKFYRKEGYNKHDDAPDACTGIIEKTPMYLRGLSDEEILCRFH